MSYKDDEKGGVLFPTRFGAANGTARERKMLDHAGGAYGVLRRKFIDPSTGATTLLKTRAGMPTFITDDDGGKKKCPIYTPVVEYGLVDSNYSSSGVGDSAGGPLQLLIVETGLIDGDNKLKDKHSWKENFFIGTSASPNDGVLYGGLPSNFSGLMRRLMQVQHGLVNIANKGYYEAAPGEKCKQPGESDGFSCRYAKTHGLYINSEGRRWIIEVSSEGVFRIPIEFMAELTDNNPGALEAALFADGPTYADAADAIAQYWTVSRFKHSEKELIAAAPTCYAEGYEPFYPWCGWAFNYTGSAATIVLAKPHETEASWYRSTLFDMTISESDGVPSYVTVAATESSPLASPVNDSIANGVAALQVPSISPGVIHTFSLYSPISTGPIHAPLFSFYEPAGKCVYYLDRYAQNTTPYSYDSDGMPETRHVSRVGSCFVGTTSTSNPEAEVHYDPTAEEGYDVTLQTQMSGIRTDSQTGTFSGGFGVSGTHYTHNHDSDRNVARAFTEYTSGESGFACSITSSIEGVSTIRWSYLAWSDGGSAYTWYGRHPVGSLGTDYFVEPVVSRVSLAHATHQHISVHDSTAIISGYDREAFAIANTRYVSTSQYTLTSSYDAAMHTGDVMFARNNGSEPGMWQPVLGADDWYQYAYIYETGEYLVSSVSGWLDSNVLAGMVFGLNYIWTTPNGGFAPNNTSSSHVNGAGSSMNYTEVMPATSTQTRSLWVRVGGTDYETSPATVDFHHVYIVDSFSFQAAGSAFKQRSLHGEDINQKPRCENVGQFVRCGRSIFGFVGVF